MSNASTMNSNSHTLPTIGNNAHQTGGAATAAGISGSNAPAVVASSPSSASAMGVTASSSSSSSISHNTPSSTLGSTSGSGSGSGSGPNSAASTSLPIQEHSMKVAEKWLMECLYILDHIQPFPRVDMIMGETNDKRGSGKHLSYATLASPLRVSFTGSLPTSSSSSSYPSSCGGLPILLVLSELGTNAALLYGDILLQLDKYKYAILAYESSLSSYQYRKSTQFDLLVRKLVEVATKEGDVDRAIIFHSAIQEKARHDGNLTMYVYLTGQLSKLLVSQGHFRRSEEQLRSALHFLRPFSVGAKGAAASNSAVGATSGVTGVGIGDRTHSNSTGALESATTFIPATSSGLHSFRNRSHPTASMSIPSPSQPQSLVPPPQSPPVAGLACWDLSTEIHRKFLRLPSTDFRSATLQILLQLARLYLDGDRVINAIMVLEMLIRVGETGGSSHHQHHHTHHHRSSALTSTVGSGMGSGASSGVVGAGVFGGSAIDSPGGSGAQGMAALLGHDPGLLLDGSGVGSGSGMAASRESSDSSGGLSRSKLNQVYLLLASAYIKKKKYLQAESLLKTMSELNGVLSHTQHYPFYHPHSTTAGKSKNGHGHGHVGHHGYTGFHTQHSMPVPSPSGLTPSLSFGTGLAMTLSASSATSASSAGSSSANAASSSTPPPPPAPPLVMPHPLVHVLDPSLYQDFLLLHSKIAFHSNRFLEALHWTELLWQAASGSGAGSSALQGGPNLKLQAKLHYRRGKILAKMLMELTKGGANLGELETRGWAVRATGADGKIVPYQPYMQQPSQQQQQHKSSNIPQSMTFNAPAGAALSTPRSSIPTPSSVSRTSHPAASLWPPPPPSTSGLPMTLKYIMIDSSAPASCVGMIMPDPHAPVQALYDGYNSYSFLDDPLSQSSCLSSIVELYLNIVFPLLALGNLPGNHPAFIDWLRMAEFPVEEAEGEDEDDEEEEEEDEDEGNSGASKATSLAPLDSFLRTMDELSGDLLESARQTLHPLSLCSAYANLMEVKLLQGRLRESVCYFEEIRKVVMELFVVAPACMRKAETSANGTNATSTAHSNPAPTNTDASNPTATTSTASSAPSSSSSIPLPSLPVLSDNYFHLLLNKTTPSFAQSVHRILQRLVRACVAYQIQDMNKNGAQGGLTNVPMDRLVPSSRPQFFGQSIHPLIPFSLRCIRRDPTLSPGVCSRFLSTHIELFDLLQSYEVEVVSEEVRMDGLMSGNSGGSSSTWGQTGRAATGRHDKDGAATAGNAEINAGAAKSAASSTSASGVSSHPGMSSSLPPSSRTGWNEQRSLAFGALGSRSSSFLRIQSSSSTSGSGGSSSSSSSSSLAFTAWSPFSALAALADGGSGARGVGAHGGVPSAALTGVTSASHSTSLVSAASAATIARFIALSEKLCFSLSEMKRIAAKSRSAGGSGSGGGGGSGSGGDKASNSGSSGGSSSRSRSYNAETDSKWVATKNAQILSKMQQIVKTMRRVAGGGWYNETVPGETASSATGGVPSSSPRHSNVPATATAGSDNALAVVSPHTRLTSTLSCSHTPGDPLYGNLIYILPIDGSLIIYAPRFRHKMIIPFRIGPSNGSISMMAIPYATSAASHSFSNDPTAEWSYLLYPPSPVPSRHLIARGLRDFLRTRPTLPSSNTSFVPKHAVVHQDKAWREAAIKWKRFMEARSKSWGDVVTGRSNKGKHVTTASTTLSSFYAAPPPCHACGCTWLSEHVWTPGFCRNCFHLHDPSSVPPANLARPLSSAADEATSKDVITAASATSADAESEDADGPLHILLDEPSDIEDDEKGKEESDDVGESETDRDDDVLDAVTDDEDDEDEISPLSRRSKGAHHADVTHDKASGNQGLVPTPLLPAIPLGASSPAPSPPPASKTLLVPPCEADVLLPPSLDLGKIREMFHSLDPQNVLLVFAAMFSECRILFVSSSNGRIQSVIHCLTRLMYPFRWEHLVVPSLDPQAAGLIIQQPNSLAMPPTHGARDELGLYGVPGLQYHSSQSSNSRGSSRNRSTRRSTRGESGAIKMPLSIHSFPSKPSSPSSSAPPSLPSFLVGIHSTVLAALLRVPVGSWTTSNAPFGASYAHHVVTSSSSAAAAATNAAGGTPNSPKSKSSSRSGSNEKQTGGRDGSATGAVSASSSYRDTPTLLPGLVLVDLDRNSVKYAAGSFVTFPRKIKFKLQKICMRFLSVCFVLETKARATAAAAAAAAAQQHAQTEKRHSMEKEEAALFTAPATAGQEKPTDVGVTTARRSSGNSAAPATSPTPAATLTSPPSATRAAPNSMLSSALPLSPSAPSTTTTTVFHHFRTTSECTHQIMSLPPVLHPSLASSDSHSSSASGGHQRQATESSENNMENDNTPTREASDVSIGGGADNDGVMIANGVGTATDDGMAMSMATILESTEQSSPRSSLRPPSSALTNGVKEEESMSTSMVRKQVDPTVPRRATMPALSPRRAAAVDAASSRRFDYNLSIAPDASSTQSSAVNSPSSPASGSTSPDASGVGNAPSSETPSLPAQPQLVDPSYLKADQALRSLRDGFLDVFVSLFYRYRLFWKEEALLHAAHPAVTSRMWKEILKESGVDVMQMERMSEAINKGSNNSPPPPEPAPLPALSTVAPGHAHQPSGSFGLNSLSSKVGGLVQFTGTNSSSSAATFGPLSSPLSIRLLLAHSKKPNQTFLHNFIMRTKIFKSFVYVRSKCLPLILTPPQPPIANNDDIMQKTVNTGLDSISSSRSDTDFNEPLPPSTPSSPLLPSYSVYDAYLFDALVVAKIRRKRSQLLVRQLTNYACAPQHPIYFAHGALSKSSSSSSVHGSGSVVSRTTKSNLKFQKRYMVLVGSKLMIFKTPVGVVVTNQDVLERQQRMYGRHDEPEFVLYEREKSGEEEQQQESPSISGTIAEMSSTGVTTLSPTSSAISIAHLVSTKKLLSKPAKYQRTLQPHLVALVPPTNYEDKFMSGSLKSIHSSSGGSSSEGNPLFTFQIVQHPDNHTDRLESWYIRTDTESECRQWMKLIESRIMDVQLRALYDKFA